MDRGMVIFLGALLTFSSSWLGLVLFPFWQLGDEKPYQKDEGDDPYPQPLQGGRSRAQDVSEQRVHVLPLASRCGARSSANGGTPTAKSSTGADISRSYGLRRTVSRDYIYDHPTMLGTMRTGPDLANIGVRNPSETWHHTHLFNPRSRELVEHHAVVRVLLHARESRRRAQ